MDRQTLQNFRTSGTTAPTSEQILDGEIAVGMNPDSPRLWTKLSDGTIAEYVSTKEILENEEVISTALNNINDTIEALSGSVSECATISYVDSKSYASGGTSYVLSMNDDGCLVCTKNGSSEGFALSTDGSLSLV